jgi:hypothetical protein
MVAHPAGKAIRNGKKERNLGDPRTEGGRKGQKIDTKVLVFFLIQEWTLNIKMNHGVKLLDTII